MLCNAHPDGGCRKPSIRQEGLDTGRRTDGLTSDERAEITRLHREVGMLREERDTSREAAASFER